jgi:hypothetical protein
MKPLVKTATFAFLITASVLAVLVWRWDFCLQRVYDKFQAPLFSAFVTLGSFLFALKSFILVTLKKEIYDTDRYKEHFRHVQEAQTTAHLYTPLKNLGNFLLYSVLFALITSTAQLTLGFIPHPVAQIICLSLAVCTLALVFRAWIAIKQSLKQWFNDLERMPT